MNRVIALITLKIVLGLVIVGGVLDLEGCRSNKTALVGKWQEVGKTEVIEFFSDGRMSVSGGVMNTAGSWTLLDDGRVKIELTVLGMTAVMTGKVEGDILRLEMDGRTGQYRRRPS